LKLKSCRSKQTVKNLNIAMMWKCHFLFQQKTTNIHLMCSQERIASRSWSAETIVNKFEALPLPVARKLVIDMFKLAKLLLCMCVSIHCYISIT
jgi:hypothetical protein